MVIRPQRAAFVVDSLLVVAIVAPLGLASCAKSDAVEPGGSGGLGGWDGAGGTSSNEAGPEGVGGADSSSSGTPDDGPSSGVGPSTSTGTTDPQSSASTGLPDDCGDGTCTLPDETCATCEADCGPCEQEGCGDGTCSAAEGEDCDSCPTDCGACVTCGDGVCDEPVEDCDLCADDCGACACEPDGFEPNNGSPTAADLTAGVPVESLSICGNDVDWFRFTKSGTATITIAFDGAEGDLDMEIYDPDYVTGSYGSGDTEEVVLSAQPNGTYYARVYGAPIGTGVESWSYSIVVSQ